MLKQQERTFPQLGFPRETDSLCPQCVIEVRDQILAGEADWRVLVNDKPGEIRARIVERDNQVFMEKTCADARHLFGPHGHGRRVPPPHRTALPGPRLPHRARLAPRPRHVLDQIRARRRPHRRPDQPLQHDVRPVLHGCQPGRLRPRAVVRRRAEDPRRRDHGQAAAAADGAVLGRRADAVAAFSRGDRLCADGRLFLGAVRHQRRPFRAGCRVRAPRARRRAAARLSAVRRHRQREKRAPGGQQPVRRQAESDREPARGRASTSRWS